MLILLFSLSSSAQSSFTVSSLIPLLSIFVLSCLLLLFIYQICFKEHYVNFLYRYEGQSILDPNEIQNEYNANATENNNNNNNI